MFYVDGFEAGGPAKVLLQARQRKSTRVIRVARRAVPLSRVSRASRDSGEDSSQFARCHVYRWMMLACVRLRCIRIQYCCTAVLVPGMRIFCERKMVGHRKSFWGKTP